MPLAARTPAATVEEYLFHEAASPLKHEYLDGQIYAMAGAGERHNRIALNIAYLLSTAARGSGCGVFISDMKLRIDTANSFYYPDVMLVCAEDNHPHYKTAPRIVVEVLSPSTAAIDRREKAQAYRRLPGLRAYLLVDSEQRAAEYWLRAPQPIDAGAWLTGTLDENEVLNIDCPPLKVSLALDDFYEDVAGLGSA